MQDIKIFEQKELMLEVSNFYDPLELDLDVWEEYLDVLCGNREYQKEAIKKSIIFMASKKYNSTEDLALENYKKNVNLQQKYSSVENFLLSLTIKNKLHANIDLATGTGKSYVIFGIAQIMLGLGLVNRVLVLCPSLTIEKGLNEKFKYLISNPELKSAIPINAVISNPRLITADQTIVKGDICVENIHAVYETTGSSIEDSFKKGGEDTLILNDESHHIYNELQGISGNSIEGKNIKKWNEFLINPIYNFQYIMGFTGTAYLGDDYFSDVIYRYSLRNAIDDRMVKSIEYVQEDEGDKSQYEKFQKIYQNHSENKRIYSRLKPLSIVVTKDINNAEKVREDLVDFLVEWEKISLDIAERKVLIVTSHNKHKSNLVLLESVDDEASPVEWIISVSMLTEGWDVKNVFQIIPWEDRAFNSKLLIAQVLGRGLRIPYNYVGTQPTVIVYNHDSWSKNIISLVNEVLEIETRLVSTVKFSGERNKYNFRVHNIPYQKVEKEKEHEEKDKILDYSNSWEKGIKLTSQPNTLKRQTLYEDLVNNTSTSRTYNIKYRTKSIDDIVNRIIYEFNTRDWEGGLLGLGDDEVYDKEKLPTAEKIKELIRNSMDLVGIVGNDLSEENANRILRSFSTLFRKSSKTVIMEKVSEAPFIIDTDQMRDESLGLSSFRRSSTFFCADDFIEVSKNNEEKIVIDEFLTNDSFPRSSSHKVNRHLFKTPLNYVFTNESPEHSFVKHLCDKENAILIDSWIKSRDRGFYQIEYSYRIANHQRQKTFNPDFFVKYERNNNNVYLVVEIKSDGDNSLENKAKYKYAIEHFAELNKKLKENNISDEYIFHFLSPKDYQTFFQYIQDGKMFNKSFKSELEVLLEDK